MKEAADAEWIATGRGIVASNGFGMFDHAPADADYGFKIRPTQQDLEEMGEK